MKILKIPALKIIQFFIVVFSLIRLIPSGIVTGLKWLEGRVK